MSIQSRLIAQKKKQTLMRLLSKHRVKKYAKETRKNYPGLGCFLTFNFLALHREDMPAIIRSRSDHNAMRVMIKLNTPGQWDITPGYFTIEALSECYYRKNGFQYMGHWRDVCNGSFVKNPQWRKKVLDMVKEVDPSILIGADGTQYPTENGAIGYRSRGLIIGLALAHRQWAADEGARRNYMQANKVWDISAAAPILVQKMNEHRESLKSLLAERKQGVFRKASIQRMLAETTKGPEFDLAQVLQRQSQQELAPLVEAFDKVWVEYNLMLRVYASTLDCDKQFAEAVEAYNALTLKYQITNAESK